MNAPDSRPPALEVEHLDFSYGRLQVLFDVSLRVPDGDIVALLGIRRRLKLGKWLGGFNGWRLVHIGIGLAATLVLVWHTGFRLGENLNLVLMASFIVTYRVSEIKNGDDFASF